MNVEIRTEAPQFLFWECINGIFVAVYILYIQKLFSSAENTRWCTLYLQNLHVDFKIVAI
jgi:hypothetical protein